MRRIGLCAFLACTVAIGQVQPAMAVGDCSVDAMVVFDGSGSMAEMGFNDLGEPRIFEARRAVREVMPLIAPYRRMGLIVYGPGSEDQCANIDLRFAPQPSAGPQIVQAVDALEPAGETPLTEAVQVAANVLMHKSKPGVIVLVTDGRETCGGAPCQLAAELAADSVDLTVHVIGFKIRGEFFGWTDSARDAYENATTVARCLADRTGGEYRSTETAEELAQALDDTLGCALISQAQPRRRLPKG